MTPYQPVADKPRHVFFPAKGYGHEGFDLSAPVTMLGKCKTCKRGVRVTAAPGWYGEKLGNGYQVGRDAYKLPDGALCYAHDGSRWNGVIVHCPHCAPGALHPQGGPARVRLQVLRGRYVADHKCDGRCMSATGPSCDCSCGGRNHGANHG